MRRFKFILSIFGGLVLLLLATGSAKAVDLTVNCTSGGPCTITPAATPLFNETNWEPGSAVTRNILVNNNDQSQTCNLVMTTSNVTQNPSNFTTALFTTINGTGTLFGGTLNGLFSLGTLSLGTINPGSSQNYAWNVTFDPNAGNEFQNAITTFDFTVNFSCDFPPTPTPTPVGGGGGGGGSVLSVAGAPTCGDTAPTKAPILSVTGITNNTVNLSWSPVNPATHYMIRYGLSSGNYIYGAPNVGNVTHFIVSALSGNTNYYFQVAAVNGCAPGPWSNQVLSRPPGVRLAAGPAQGFTEQTLGVATEAPSPTPTPIGVVEAASTAVCTDKPYPWWIPLVIQLLISFIYIWIRWKDKPWWIVVAGIAVISQIIHEILGCNCGVSGWCRWYWVFNVLIVAASILLHLYRKRSKKD